MLSFFSSYTKHSISSSPLLYRYVSWYCAVFHQLESSQREKMYQCIEHSHWFEFIASHGRTSSSLFFPSSVFFRLSSLRECTGYISSMPLWTTTFSRKSFNFFSRHLVSELRKKGFGGFYQFLPASLSLLLLMRFPTGLLSDEWIGSALWCIDKSKAPAMNSYCACRQKKWTQRCFLHWWQSYGLTHFYHELRQAVFT